MHNLFFGYPEEKELLKACQVLYGKGNLIDHRFLERLQPGELKSIYRKRAMDTHPDRLRALGIHQQLGVGSFIEVSQAYEKLAFFLKERARFKKKPFDWFAYHESTAAPCGFYGEGSFRKSNGTHLNFYPRNYHFQSQEKDPSRKTHSLPRWQLRLGEYFFYTGIISWKELIDALIWQKNCRPRIGEIAMHWRWISPDQMRQVFLLRNRGEKTGEVLMRLGIINAFEKAILLRHQRRLQPRIGKYFIEGGKMVEKQVVAHLYQLAQHNLHISIKTKAKPAGAY